MQYMLIHVVPTNFEHEEPLSAELEASLMAWLDEVIPLGVDLHGSRIVTGADATTVRSRNGKVLLTDGPFAETKEQIAGYDVLECADLDEAVGWARKHPTVTIGAIEVRPFMPGSLAKPLPDIKEGMTRYMLLVCLGEDFHMSPQEGAEMGPATDAWVKEMDGKGARLFGSQLEGPEKARTVRGSTDQLLVTDGPFAETKEQIAGFDILECADLDEAIDIAAKHPMAKFGMLELRPFWP